MCVHTGVTVAILLPRLHLEGLPHRDMRRVWSAARISRGLPWAPRSFFVRAPFSFLLICEKISLVRYKNNILTNKSMT